MKLDNEIRKSILQKLIFNPKLSFSQLWDRSVESNKFTYHLKTMLKDDLITKKGDKYSLTKKGIDFVTYVDSIKVEVTKQPLVVVFCLVKKGNKILVHRRLKEPFYGYCGTPGGKVSFGETLIETAKRELKEETGLEVKDGRLISIKFMRTYDKKTKELIHHHIGFLFEFTEFDGELIERTKVGENFWCVKSKLKKLDIFPEMVDFFETTNNSKLKIIEMNRYQDGLRVENVTLFDYMLNPDWLS